MRDSGWKLIEAPRPELYDLRNDPREMENLYREDHPSVVALGPRLTDVRSSLHEKGPRDFSADDRSRLAALGYVFSGPGEGSPNMQGLRDPKDLVHLMAVLETGRNHLAKGHIDEGLECFRQVLAEDPANLEAHHQLGNHYKRSRNWAEAERHYRSILETGHSWPAVHAYLGEIRHQQGLELAAKGRPDEARARFEEAIELLRVAHRLDPREGTHAAKMGSIYWEDLGDIEAAERTLRESLQIVPDSPPVNMVLALLLAGEKRLQEALPYFDTALMGDDLPQDLRIRLFVEAAKTHALLGRYDRAAEIMAALIQAYPDHPNASAWRETRLKLSSLSGR
jgi:Flp pilus assembly protein TadD